MLSTANHKLAAALRAIRARVDGEFDHPDLMAFGPLRDTDTDCAEIAKRALAEYESVPSAQDVGPAYSGLDYEPGELDRTAPERIWLQIDTDGGKGDRNEPWPGADDVTWQDTEIGGLEIQYVRTDIACTQATEILHARLEASQRTIEALRIDLSEAVEVRKQLQITLRNFQEVRPEVPVPRDLIEAAARHACRIQGIKPDQITVAGTNERQWERLSGTVHAALHYYASRMFVTNENAAPQAAAMPEGYVLVPSHLHVAPDAWETAAFTFGGPANGDGTPYHDCTLWVGYMDNDDGSKTYGLHVSCDECPEEGSITLAEFAPATAPEAQPQGEAK